MDDYVSKPFDALQLITMISNMLPDTGLQADSKTVNATAEQSAAELPTPGNTPAAPSPEEDQNPPIEWSSFLHRCLDKPTLAAKVMGKFEEKAHADVEQIHISIQAGDADRIALLAHAMKGAAANLSAESLRLAAATLEQMGRTNTLDDVTHQFNMLQEEVERCLVQIAQEKAKIPNT